MHRRHCARACRRALAIPLLLAACHANEPTGVPAASITIRLASGDIPTAGAAIPIEIINESGDAQGYNLCVDAQLELLRAGQWTSAIVGDRICALPLTVLAARARGTAVYLLPRTLVAGTYRLVVHFRPERVGASPVRATSEPFTLQ